MLRNFLVRTLQYLKKKLAFFFAPENMKKPPSKVAHNGPRPFFSVLAWLPKRPKKKEISYHQKPLNAGLGI